MAVRRRRVDWRLRVAMAVVLAGAMGFGAPRPVGATTTGVGVFSGVATLAIFPCTTPPCAGGGFTGTAALSLSGVGTSSVYGVPLPYTAAWSPTTSVLTAGFTYDESCDSLQPTGTPPLTGNANGTFSLSGGLVSIAGSMPTSGTLSGSFHWQRFGVGVTVALFTLSITTAAGTVAINLIDLIKGQSASGFVWTNGPGTCPANGQANQTADVAGVALQVV